MGGAVGARAVHAFMGCNTHLETLLLPGITHPGSTGAPAHSPKASRLAAPPPSALPPRQDLSFSRPFSLTAQREGRVSALLAYFDVGFTCRGAPPGGGAAVTLTTHPMAPATGWLQTLFCFPRALQVGARAGTAARAAQRSPECRREGAPAARGVPAGTTVPACGPHGHRSGHTPPQNLTTPQPPAPQKPQTAHDRWTRARSCPGRSRAAPSAAPLAACWTLT